MSGEAWEVKVTWMAAEGVVCPESTTYQVPGENAALDAAVSVMDGARHPWSLVRAERVEIRAVGGAWRAVGAGHVRSWSFASYI